MLERVKKEAWQPLLLFIFFLGFSLPGVEWGTPALWNPDELVWRAENALQGELVFDETEPDYNYPSLPKYIMYGIGKIVYGLGFSSSKFIIAARSFSALLGALSAILVYMLARSAGMSPLFSTLSGVFYISSSLAVTNSRFAHNDLYLQFFAILCVYASLQYQIAKKTPWILAAFFFVGLAASSKYTGGSLLLLPIFVLIGMNWREFYSNWMRKGELLFLGGVLSYLGYVTGTPKALFFWEYFPKVIPALQRYPQYGFNSGSAIGLFGQWAVFRSGVGEFVYYLFLLAFVWCVAGLILRRFGKVFFDPKKASAVSILSIAILIFDFPFLISINYIPRYFIPFVPFLAILASFFIGDLCSIFRERRFFLTGLSIIMFLGIAYSTLRLVSVALLFMNDARIPATSHIATFRGYKKTIEYTLYPPYINKKQFYGAARNYPIFFVKYSDDVVPSGGRFEYNRGEQGLLERNVDYFVIDSYTYDRFSNPSICASNPVECDFFKELLSGKVNSYRLLKEFTYQLPPYLPQLQVTSVNPEIRIYERVR